MKKYFIYILAASLTVSCSESIKKDPETLITKTVVPLEVPCNTVNESELFYHKKNSLWTLDGVPFSGYAVSYYPDTSALKQKFGILKGRKQNESIRWYPNGLMQYSTNYYKGKLHGEKKVWSSDSAHVLVAHINFYLGKAQGVQKKWYSSGEIYQILHMNDGKEEGIQKAYRKNGALYANYEAKNGRIFGLKKAALCYNLKDEKVQYQK